MVGAAEKVMCMKESLHLALDKVNRYYEKHLAAFPNGHILVKNSFLHKIEKTSLNIEKIIIRFEEHEECLIKLYCSKFAQLGFVILEKNIDQAVAEFCKLCSDGPDEWLKDKENINIDTDTYVETYAPHFHQHYGDVRYYLKELQEGLDDVEYILKSFE
jgi:hypothetical protein